jgi:hypothetical protein
MSDNAGTLVLHGYTRPGHGWIIGRCYGVAAAPFPATDRLEAWELAVVNSIDATNARIAKLKSGRVKTLSFDYEQFVLDKDGRIVRGRGYPGADRKVTATTEVNAGDAERQIDQFVNDFRGKQYNEYRTIPAFDVVMDRAIADSRSRLAQMKSELSRVRARITKGRALRAAKLAPFVGVRTVLVTVPRAVAS